MNGPAMSAPRAKPAARAPATGLLTEVYVTVSVEMKKVTKRSNTRNAVNALAEMIELMRRRYEDTTIALTR